VPFYSNSRTSTALLKQKSVCSCMQSMLKINETCTITDHCETRRGEERNVVWTDGDGLRCAFNDPQTRSTYWLGWSRLHRWAQDRGSWVQVENTLGIILPTLCANNPELGVARRELPESRSIIDLWSKLNMCHFHSGSSCWKQSILVQDSAIPYVCGSCFPLLFIWSLESWSTDQGSTAKVFCFWPGWDLFCICIHWPYPMDPSLAVSHELLFPAGGCCDHTIQTKTDFFHWWPSKVAIYSHCMQQEFVILL